MRVAWPCVLLLALGACRSPAPKVVPDPPILVDEVRFEGFDALPGDARDSLARGMPLKAGERLTDEKEQAAGERAVEILQDHGYPYAQVGLAREPAGEGRTRLIFRAQPGPRGLFGRIDIAGNRRVDGRIIRRRVAYAPGDPFSRSAIAQTQQQIGGIGLFKSVEVRVAPRGEGAETPSAVEVPTIITVEERSPWQWNLGLGYAAGDRLGVDARVSHLDLFGSARRLDLEGRVSAIEQRAEVTFTQADSWHPSLALSVLGRHQEIDERSFFVLSRGGQASAAWQWTRELSTTGSYAATLERSDVDSTLEALAGLQDGMLHAWSLDVDHRRFRDTAATQSMSLHLEQAGGWLPGTFNYLSLGGDLRRYQRIAGTSAVLAARLRYGSIDPFSIEADVPLLKRFFLGGSSDMRGWGLYELSPLSASGEPVGGKSVFTAAVEARVPLAARLRGVLFAEAGNVWQDPWTLKPNRLLYDAGAGVRVDTPFGRIRLDAGYQMKPLEGLLLDGTPQRSRWRVHVGLGEAF